MSSRYPEIDKTKGKWKKNYDYSKRYNPSSESNRKSLMELEKEREKRRKELYDKEFNRIYKYICKRLSGNVIELGDEGYYINIFYSELFDTNIYHPSNLPKFVASYNFSALRNLLKDYNQYQKFTIIYHHYHFSLVYLKDYSKSDIIYNDNELSEAIMEFNPPWRKEY